MQNEVGVIVILCLENGDCVRGREDFWT